MPRVPGGLGPGTVFPEGVKDSVLYVMDSGVYGLLAGLHSGSPNLWPQLLSAPKLEPYSLAKPSSSR
jgi:hypothetical protein